jgi:hypothetical protein
MPEESSSLSCNSEVVHISLVCLNRALCDVCWPICPSTLKLTNSMPVQLNSFHHQKYTLIFTINTNHIDIV